MKSVYDGVGPRQRLTNLLLDKLQGIEREARDIRNAFNSGYITTPEVHQNLETVKEMVKDASQMAFML